MWFFTEVLSGLHFPLETKRQTNTLHDTDCRKYGVRHVSLLLPCAQATVVFLRIPTNILVAAYNATRCNPLSIPGHRIHSSSPCAHISEDAAEAKTIKKLRTRCPIVQVHR